MEQEICEEEMADIKELREQYEKQHQKKSTKAKINTEAAYRTVYTKYKAFVDFLREKVNIDEFNAKFIESCRLDPGTILYKNFEKNKLVGTGKIAKKASKEEGEEVPYSVIPEKYISGGISGIVKLQLPIMLIDFSISQYGPSAKIRFRNGNVSDTEVLEMFSKIYEREREILIEQKCVPGIEDTDTDEQKLRMAKGSLKDSVYTPVDKDTNKKIEGADKTMFVKLYNYTGNRTNIMFPNGFKIPFEDLYGVTIVALPVIRLDKLHIGSKPSSQRYLMSAIIYDIIETRGSEEKMTSQVECSRNLLDGLDEMNSFVPDAVPIGPSIQKVPVDDGDRRFVPESSVTESKAQSPVFVVSGSSESSGSQKDSQPLFIPTVNATKTDTADATAVFNQFFK